jgi:peptide/nickel transport system substrate-binding protein
MSTRKAPALAAVLIVISLILSACQPQPTPSVPTPVLPPTQAPQPDPGQEQPPLPPVPTPARSLVICLGQEPATLYPFGSSAPSMWSVLEAIYDGPYDTLQFEAQPVIMQNVPSFENGDAVLVPVDVLPGDEVVDASGELAALSAGLRVLPSGCTDPDCAITWDGSDALQMDRLVLRYRMLPGLTWSDGMPLTASDSVFAYEIAQDPATPVSRRLLYRTAAYTAVEETIVEWHGVPGFFPTRFDNFFWLPQPRHILGGISPAQLLIDPLSTRQPLGWGPYVIQDWVEGDHIKLARNERYFRASEGLPVFDSLVYRFLGRPGDNNLVALLINECDIVDQTSLLDEQLESVLDLEKDGKLKAYIAQGSEWEHLDFGIFPASYDDGYNPVLGDRPDLFFDLRVRQAFAYCADRQGIVDRILFGQTSVPGAYLPPSHPNFLADLAPLPFDIEAGRRLLDEAGWKDLDGDPGTPRTAVGVANVYDGAVLSVNYVTTQAPLRVQVAQVLADSLAQCGIQVNVQHLTPGELYVPGPEGILFGRKFDLAQFAWEAGIEPPCYLYESDQIPTAGNNWLKVNITGFSSPIYDAACQAASQVHPSDGESYFQAHAEVQRLFAQELPSIPLFFRLKMAVSRPDLCGLSLDGTARSALWNLELFDYGSGCEG